VKLSLTEQLSVDACRDEVRSIKSAILEISRTV